MTDHRDLAIATLADSEAELREQVVRYRALVLAALEQLHNQHIVLERLRGQHYRLLDEYRHLRTQMMRADAHWEAA